METVISSAAPVQLEGLTPATGYMVEAVLVFRGGGTGPPLTVDTATSGDGEDREENEEEGGREGMVGSSLCCVSSSLLFASKHTFGVYHFLAF